MKNLVRRSLMIAGLGGFAACSSLGVEKTAEQPALVVEYMVGSGTSFASVSVANIPIPIGAGTGIQTVIIPAVTRSVTARVMTQEARTVERVIPGVTRQNADGETVVVQEASIELMEFPAVYEDVVTVEISDAERREIRTVEATPEASLQTVQVAINPFSWDEIEAENGRRPPEFIPPAAKARYLIEPIVFAKRDGADVSLKEVHDRLMGLIDAEDDENFQSRLFSHPSGFVILTSPERIDDTAQAIKVDGKRIGIEDNINVGVVAFFKSIFLPDPKRFRVISFTVSQTSENPGVPFETGRDFNKIMRTGGFADFVFENYLRRFYLRQNNFQVEVGIHEFSRVDEARPAESFWSRYELVPVAYTLARHRAGSTLINATYAGR